MPKASPDTAPVLLPQTPPSPPSGIRVVTVLELLDYPPIRTDYPPACQHDFRCPVPLPGHSNRSRHSQPHLRDTCCGIRSLSYLGEVDVVLVFFLTALGSVLDQPLVLGCENATRSLPRGTGRHCEEGWRYSRTSLSVH